MTPTEQELIERYKGKVDQRGPAECWPWLGLTARAGRGRLYWQGKNYVAPRIAWLVAHGQMPPLDLFVCHHCDNPNCVNPAHLFLGTNSDNMLDARRKGRLSIDETRQTSYAIKMARTHCYKGHEYTEGNTRYRQNLGRETRICITCDTLPREQRNVERREARMASAATGQHFTSSTPHANVRRVCVCGRICYGNGGWSSHRKTCPAIRAEKGA